MASRTQLSNSIDQDLDRAQVDVEELADFVTHWDEVHPGFALGYELEWRDASLGLDRLAELRRSGQLSQQQSARLEAIIATLAPYVARMRELELRVPEAVHPG